MAVDMIEQFISLGLQLIGAAVDYAGGGADDRPAAEVSADIRRLRTISGALVAALDQAERRAMFPTVLPASSQVRPATSVQES